MLVNFVLDRPPLVRWVIIVVVVVNCAYSFHLDITGEINSTTALSAVNAGGSRLQPRYHQQLSSSIVA